MKKSLGSKYHALISLLLFSGISVVYFGLHVILHLNTHFVGGGADPTIYIWSFAWFAHAILIHQGFFFSNVIFHPTGINLTKVTVIPGLAFLFFPITYFFGPVVSYNLCAIFAPGLAAWTAYFLCRYLTQSTLSAFFGGYFFGFSCYIIAQSLGHLNLIVPAILIPLFVLTILYRLDKKISGFAFIALLTLLLIFLFSIEIEVFATFSFWGLVCYVTALCFFKEKRDALVKLIKPIVIACLLTLIFLSPYIYYFFCNNEISSSFPSAAINFSNALFGFILPIRIFLINSSFPASDWSEFNGYIGLGLFVLFIFYTQQQRHKTEAKFLITITTILAVATLGPALHVAKTALFNFPWQVIFTKIPLLNAALPCRIALYMSLSLAIIVALWMKNCTWHLKYRLLTVFLAAFLLVPSFNNTHRPMVESIYIPSFFSTGVYKKYISQNDNVIILPYIFGPAMLWQAQTHFTFNLAGGFLGAPPLNYANDKVFNAMRDRTPKNITTKDMAQFIKKHHVTKVIILNEQSYQRWAITQSFRMGVDMNDYSAWSSVIKPLSAAPIKVGGITLYTILS